MSAVSLLPAALQGIDIREMLLPAFEDEKDVTLTELVGMLDPPREEVQDAIPPCMNAGRCVTIVTTESLYRKIRAFDHLEEFIGYSYPASEFGSSITEDSCIAMLGSLYEGRTISSNFCLNKATQIPWSSPYSDSYEIGP
ncbi:hypothetical protein Nepgr_032808 [Nepenthes gracilis]|uniref:Uncharacterized protein n=1 Tax=Nepenthes gracilis TaxID=150966 RepID=A0AAD3TJC3_NEPGR|nr:hypothetical protein Nepgr_032808 [Nepenthes gracilis]